MSEPFLIIKNFTENNPDLVTWGVAGLILLLGFAFQYTGIKEALAEWKLKKLLKNAGTDVLHNVTIPDGMDGNIFVEYLVLTPEEIILLSVKKYRGLIFAAEKIDLWTQVVGSKSYKFNNPLLQLESDAQALMSRVENATVSGKVLFIKGSEFPKGKPESVISVTDVKEWSENDIAPPQALLVAWETLSALAADNDFTKRVLVDEEYSTNVNILSLVVFFVAISIWLMWRLLY